MQTSKEDIVQFLRNEYQRTGKARSIRAICDRFEASSKTLYEMFPGRKTEMCFGARIPVDEESLKKVEKAGQALKGKRKKSARENRELRSLKLEEDRIAREVRQIKEADERRERIRKLYVEKAKASGILDIFSSPEKLLDFAVHAHKHGSLILNDEDILDALKRICKARAPLAKTLYEVVGPLDDYEAAIEEKEVKGLDEYIDKRLEGFILDRDG